MHPTAEIIASWPAPNYDNPVTRGSALTVVNIIFIILVFVVAGLRFYTRLRITRSFGLDDWVIAASLVPTFALTCVVLVADNNFGWDRHSWDLHAENGPAGYKLCITAQVLFFWAATLNKISLLCFYRRLAGPCTPRWYSWSINGGIVFQIFMVLAYFLALLLGCRPLKAFWTPLATFSYTCIDFDRLMLSFSVITIFLDFVILLLPVPVVWSLQLPKKQRIAVLGLFAAGIIVCVAGIVHAYFVDQALVKSYDETWEGWPLWIASAVEVDLGILCVSVPALRPLLALYFPRFLEVSHHQRDIKEITNSNETSEHTPSPGSDQENSFAAASQGSGYFGGDGSGGEKDVERGLGSRDDVVVGHTAHAMQFTDFSKYASA